MGLINKLFNLTKRAVQISEQQDSTTNGKKWYNTKIKAYGSIYETQVYYPYGYYANAPNGSQHYAISTAAQSENNMAFPYDNQTQFTGLKPGEVMMGHQRLKSFIKFLNDGSINLETPKGNLNIKVLQGNAEINISGDETTTISGNLTKNITGAVDIASQGNFEVKSSELLILDGATKVEIISGTGVLTLTSSGLVSNVPISAPEINVTGGGGIAMSGGTVSGAADYTTQAGKSFNNHTHSPGTFEAGGDPVTGISGTLV
jgi:hypothetical protein